jgi:lipopolysaccharide export system protein LptA
MRVRGLLGALLLAVPAIGSAQQLERPQEPRRAGPSGQTETRSCRQVLRSDVRRLVNARSQEIIYFRDPVRVLCTGGLVLEADSAVMNRSTSAIQLIGNVFYQDSVRQLTADWANYIGQRSQLLARGNVVLRNLDDGSVIEGDELDYLQATETRPEGSMLVRGERPYAVIPPQPDSTGQVPDTAVSTEVWADRMEFQGESLFRGIGNVALRRGAMEGAGDVVVFDQREERMTLSGQAFFHTERYRLEGAQIDAYLADDEIRTVTAERMARVISDELSVESERIRIGFSDGRLERMEAWNPAPDSVARALADAEGFRLRADSIDARADSLGIREVRAVGRAYGERDADTVAVVADAISRDWIQGDTIIGYFSRVDAQDAAEAPELVQPDREPDPDPAVTLEDRGTEDADSTETVLERIVVIGGQGAALSLYRMAAEEPGQPPSINFLKALTITLFMVEGDVTRVEADGPLEGVYLSPGRRPEGGGEGREGGEGASVGADRVRTGAGPGEAGTGGGR